MEIGIVLILAVGILIYFGTRKNNKSAPLSAEENDWLNGWFKKQNIDLDSVSYSVHNDKNILAEGTEKLVVGFGKTKTGPEGFYAEIKSDGLGECRLINPSCHIPSGSMAVS